jgi:hypothetical protein
MYHCHVQNHSDMGMSGLFLVRNADGSETADERAAVARWHQQEMEHHKMMIPALLQMGLRPDGRPREGSAMATAGAGGMASGGYPSGPDGFNYGGGQGYYGGGTKTYKVNGRIFKFNPEQYHGQVLGPPGQQRQVGY